VSRENGFVRARIAVQSMFACIRAVDRTSARSYPTQQNIGFVCAKIAVQQGLVKTLAVASGLPVT
jgi:hypothetical protein